MDLAEQVDQFFRRYAAAAKVFGFVRHGRQGVRVGAGVTQLQIFIKDDESSLRGRFVRGPGVADVPYPVQMEPNLVIEFYSR